MREIQTEIEIDAPPARVWDILTDFATYHAWNPYTTSITGELHAGAQLTARFEPPGGRAMTIKPRLLRCDAPSELRWRGTLLVSQIFNGEHIFELHPLDGDRTRFVQREEFRGVLVRLMLRVAGKSTRAGFVAMNEALKARAEAP